MTNVPQPTFGPTGFTTPLRSDIVAGVWADFQSAFGNNLNEALETPQGQLVTSLSEIIGSAYDLFALYVNQVDPAFADGTMQDAIARIYFLTRAPATSTIVAATGSGATGTVIPVGSLAKATDGNLYQALSTATIPSSGSVVISFAGVNTGPIPCPAGSLTTIYRTIPGWDSITNPADGIVGSDAESRADFEARRAASVAINANGILSAIRGEVLNVAGIVDAYVTENPTASAATIGGVSIAAHSLYVAAQGGTDADVARAIWTKKAPGCGYVGNTTVAVTDTNSGYTTPPSYNVTFQRPTALATTFVVTLANGADVPSDVVSQVQAAIAAEFQNRAHIGTKLYASQFYAAISALGAWVRIESVTINGGNDLAVNINQFPTLNSTSGITVTLV